MDAHEGHDYCVTTLSLKADGAAAEALEAPTTFGGPPSPGARIKLALSWTVIQHVALIANHGDAGTQHLQLRQISTPGSVLELAIRDSCPAILSSATTAWPARSDFKLVVRLHPGEYASTSLADPITDLRDAVAC